MAQLRRAVRRSGAPIVASVLGMAVAGCAVGPDFMSPEPPSVARYTSPGEATALHEGGEPTVPTQAIALGARVTAEWWTLFRSAKLDALVKQAIVGSHTLESAKARLAQAREAIAAASSALYPQVGFNAGDTQEKQTAASFGLGPNVAPLPPTFNFFQVGPTASYTLDLFGGTRRHIEQESALADYQRDELNAAYLSLTGNTVTLAIQGAAVRAQLKAVQDIIDIDQQNVELVRKERLAGAVPDSDVIVAESQLATDETLLPGLDQQSSVAKHALAVLVGRAPGEWSPPEFDLTALTLPRQLPVSLPSELVHQRPDIQAAEAQLHAASAQIGIATAQLYPSITLSAGISGSSLDGGLSSVLPASYGVSQRDLRSLFSMAACERPIVAPRLPPSKHLPPTTNKSFYRRSDKSRTFFRHSLMMHSYWKHRTGPSTWRRSRSVCKGLTIAAVASVFSTCSTLNANISKRG